MAKKILVSAGDPSGDLILSRLVREIQEKAGADAPEFFGLAGPNCEAAGVRLIAKSQDVAVVGVTEVLKNLGKILGTLKTMENALAQADGLLCVDFPDFNFKLAARAKKMGKPVDYLVAPQIWAWRHGRISQLKNFVRRLYPILPFEEGFFREAGIDAHYFGHPIRDVLPPKARKSAREDLKIHSDDFLFALLPGSRRSELAKHLPIFVEAWHELRIELSRRRDSRIVRVVLPLAPGLTLEDLKATLTLSQQRKFQTWIDYREWVIDDDSWKTLQAADFGWIASGTASLEAAYYQIPHILVYKLNRLSALLIQRGSHFSTGLGLAGLPNILLEKSVIPELLQSNLDPKRLRSETVELLYDQGRLQALNRELRWLPKKMGASGVLERIAEDYLKLWSF